jgi:hypothetical protein
MHYLNVLLLSLLLEMQAPYRPSDRASDEEKHHASIDISLFLCHNEEKQGLIYPLGGKIRLIIN